MTGRRSAARNGLYSASNNLGEYRPRCFLAVRRHQQKNRDGHVCTSVHILRTVDYEWDPAKARANFAKHAIRFADAATVLEDDLALTIRDPFSEDEERWVTVGKDALGRVLVYTWRGENVRMISARIAT